jgi:hypothetical protein
MHAIGTPIGAGLLIGGVLLLRRSWQQRGGSIWLVHAGWLALAGGLVAFGQTWGAKLGGALGLMGLSLAGYAAVAATIEMRAAVGRGMPDVALDPEQRPTNWPRGIAKALLAIVLSGIAALGLGLNFALYVPMTPPDRIVIGGILVPVLWGGGMAWTLSDPRLLRATLLLTAISLLCYGAAFLPQTGP